MADPRTRRLYPVLTLVVLAAVGGCGETEAPSEPPPGGSNGNGGAIVSGQITHDGPGVGSVDILLSGSAGDDREATTGSDGSFSFSQVPEGTWELEVRPPTWFELAEGEAAVRQVDVGASGTTTVSVQLAPPTPRDPVQIDLGAAAFMPSDLTVPPGTRVIWANQVNDMHTITPTDHSEWTRGTVATSGDTFEAVLNNPGVFDYYCEPHSASGMEGTVTVAP